MKSTETIENIEEQIAQDLKDRFSSGWETQPLNCWNYEFDTDGKLIFLTGVIRRADGEDDELYIEKVEIFDKSTQDIAPGAKIMTHKIEDYFNN